MEYMGFQRSKTYLTECGIKISTFISDRHTSSAKLEEKYVHVGCFSYSRLRVKLGLEDTGLLLGDYTSVIESGKS